MYCSLLPGFLDENQNETRDTDKEYELGSRDLIGDGLTPPEAGMTGDEDGESDKGGARVIILYV